MMYLIMTGMISFFTFAGTISLKPTSSFQWLYDDTRSGAKEDVSLWRPKRPKHLGTDYHSLGDIAMKDHNRAPKLAWFIKAKNADDLTAPVSYQKIWHDQGSGDKHDVTFWRPVAPPHYVCLGDVAMPNYQETPSLDLIRCVHENLLLPAKKAREVWKHKVLIWEASKEGVPSGIAANTFLAHADTGYLLRMESIEGYPLEMKAQKFAPHVYLHPEEEFFPSDVFFHFKHTVERDGYLTADLSCANCANLPFLRGINPAHYDVPMYAFISPKETPHDERGGIRRGQLVKDIIYFTFYPYNRGKYVDPILWDKTWYGDHVGDWEHFTVRFVDGYPYQMYMAQHNQGYTFEWGSKEVALDDNFRPIIYSAKGSHGLYPFTGKHIYKKVEVARITVVPLIDEMGQGVHWDGSRNLQILPVLAPGSYTEPQHLWMNYQQRWGNKKAACIDMIGVCRLEDGPVGPAGKSYIYAQSFDLD